MGENTVEDHGPDIAQHDAADQVGHKEHRAEQVGTLDALGQSIGHGKGQRIDEQHRHEGKQRREPEGVEEAAVRECLDVVAKPYPIPLADHFELTERQKQLFLEKVKQNYEYYIQIDCQAIYNIDTLKELIASHVFDYDNYYIVIRKRKKIIGKGSITLRTQKNKKINTSCV